MREEKKRKERKKTLIGANSLVENIVPIRFWYTYNGIVCIKYKGSRLIISPQQNTIKALNVDPSVWLGVIYYTVFLVLLRVELVCVSGELGFRSNCVIYRKIKCIFNFWFSVLTMLTKTNERLVFII